MTIEEAIQHCRETARGLRNRGETLAAMGQDGTDCAECAAEHEQLAAWLEELQEKRCKVIVQANRIKELEDLLKKQESPQKACTTCGKRTLCPGPASGRPRTGCSFWTAEEALR